MRIKQNPLVKGLLAVMVIVPIYFFATHADKPSEKGDGAAVQSNKPAETSNEEIAALSGYLSTVENEQKTIKRQLANLITKEDVEALLQAADHQSTNIELQDLLAKVNRLINERANALQEKILELGTVPANQLGNVDDEIPFSDTFEEAFDVDMKSQNDENAVTGDEIQWVYPLGLNPEKGVDGFFEGLPTLGKQVNAAAGSVKKDAIRAKKALEAALKPIPYATIHADSSIHGATALTALVGRIERKGKTHDPFRFQVILSGDTLMANGHSMPGVANAFVSGSATGDRAFSCVRGKVTSITFNFSDGRIYKQKGTFEQPLAEIGDLWGNPCIKGILLDDINQFVAVQGAVSGLASLAETITKQQQSITSAGNSQSLQLSGSAGKLAAGSFATGGLNKGSELLAERFENYYQAVYVPPGEKISLLFTEDIAIDYKPSNRKISYEDPFHGLTDLD